MPRFIFAVALLVGCSTQLSCGPSSTPPAVRSATATPDVGPGGAVVCEPSADAAVTVALLPQKTSMWCWAASAQMIMKSFNADIAQCRQANDRFNLTTCCATPTPDDCINGGWPKFQKYGFSAKHTTNTALSWDELRRQIGCRKVPVAFTWRWLGGSGHMMVASGYATRNGVKWVTVLDPWPVDVGGDVAEVPYEVYRVGDDHTHWDDYYDIARDPPTGSAPPRERP